MLEEIFNKGLINKWRFLLSYYKLINLNKEQLVVLLLIMNSSSSNKKSITPLEISSYSNFNLTKIESILNELKQGGFLNINKKEEYSLDLSNIFNKIVVVIENQNDLVTRDEIFEKLEQLLGPLTKTQITTLEKFVNNVIDDKQLLVVLNNLSTETSYDALISLLEKHMKSRPKSLTKYNWLSD